VNSQIRIPKSEIPNPKFSTNPPPVTRDQLPTPFRFPLSAFRFFKPPSITTAEPANPLEILCGKIFPLSEFRFPNFEISSTSI
jgi:hypothetical protein